MSFETWLAFCLTETVLCFTPGPAVLLVVSMALGSGLRPSLGGALGILCANTLYFAISASGVAAALVASQELFLVLKWAGAAYLIWLGLRMLMSRSAPTARPQPIVLARSFVRGFLVQGANPKSLVFFAALLPQFLDPAAPLGVQVAVLGISSLVIEMAALGTYAILAVRTRALAGARVSGALERVGGGFLVAAGVRLAAVRPE